jgi:hypothetical protein
LAGALYDAAVMILKACAYFLAGVLIVSAVLCLFMFLIGLVTG